MRADLVGEPLAPGGTALEGERRVELVRTAVDPAAQRLAARLLAGRLLKRAVFQHLHVPAEGGENAFDALPQPLAHDAVEALAIVVDHPPGVAQVMFPALLQAFIDIAFIEFRIADQRDHPACRACLGPWLGGNIVLHDGGEGGDRHAEADGASREIDVVDVLGTARIGLRAAKAAEIFKLFPALVAHQILDGVEDGGGVWLDRHAVFRAKHTEIERCHDSGQRCRGGLMPADLHFALFPQVIGVVDRPAGMPQDLSFQILQACQSRRRQTRFRHLHLAPSVPLAGMLPARERKR